MGPLGTKRLRWYLEREPRAISPVLQILLRGIEANLRQGSSAGSPARFGASRFIRRFGAAISRNINYHCCDIDGVFEPGANPSDLS